MFRHPSKHASDAVSSPNTRPDDISSLSVAYASPANMLHRRQMPLEEAEALVRQWQDIKAEALGPNHQIQALSDILAESMLSRVTFRGPLPILYCVCFSIVTNDPFLFGSGMTWQMQQKPACASGGLFYCSFLSCELTSSQMILAVRLQKSR